MTTRPGAIALGCTVAVCVLAAGCTRHREPPRGIVMITLDTTRADHLGCYGDRDAATPNLDRLAAGATLFLQAQSAVPVTFPSHTTMFTGLYPPVHGIRYNGMFHLEDSSVTLAELLRDAGWKTVGVPASFPMAARTGIGQGFEVYEDMFDVPDPPPLNGERKAAEISKLGIEFLRGVGKQKFFLWLHFWDAHYPYVPPFPFSARYRDRPYDGEIAYVDQEVGKVFDALKELGLWDRTLVLVVGDHGEGLYDHDEKMHANLVYQSTLHVPLIVKPPGPARARKVREPVTLADVAPTLLDFAGVAGPKMEGISLKPAVEGQRPPRRDLYFESLAGALVYGWSPLEGVRRGRWKYIRSPSPELFDLDADPGEKQNLYGIDSKDADPLEAQLGEWESAWKGAATTADASPTPVDQETLEALASLGYVGGSMTEERRDGPDPKRLIHLELETFAGRDELAAHAFPAALARMERVLKENPTNRNALRMATSAAFGMGDYDRALELTDRTLEIYPESAPAWIQRGTCYVAKKELSKAAEAFRQGLEHQPEDVGLSYRLAAALYALDRAGEARALVEQMMTRDLGSALPSYLVLRGACLAKLGDPGGALDALKQAVAKGYRDRRTLEDEPLLEALRQVPGFDGVLATIPEPAKAS